MDNKKITEKLIRDVLDTNKYRWNHTEQAFVIYLDSLFIGRKFEPFDDMNAAWMLVEKLMEGLGNSAHIFCEEMIKQTDPRGDYVNAIGGLYSLLKLPCPAYAICMAALATVEKMNESVTP